MTAVTYTPRAGSTAERAAALLCGGREMDASSLADATECEPASSLHPSMATGVTHGYFRKRIANGRCFYSMASEQVGDAEAALPPPPPAPASAPDPDDQPMVQRVVPAAEAAPLPAAARQPASFFPPTVTAPAVAAPAERLRIAMWSDGVLVVERPTERPITFTVDETRQLLAYLDRLSEPTT